MRSSLRWQCRSAERRGSNWDSQIRVKSQIPNPKSQIPSPKPKAQSRKAERPKGKNQKSSDRRPRFQCTERFQNRKYPVDRVQRREVGLPLLQTHEVTG